MSYKQDIKVKYGDFTFPVPSPFVSRNYSNETVGGNLWGTNIEVTLVGEIALLPDRDTVDRYQYKALSDKREEIAKAFAGALGKNYQTFNVSGHGEDFTLEDCVVQSVQFATSPYRGIVPYTIVLSGRDRSNASTLSNFGVTEPTDNWQYSENSGIASLVHTISAAGYNTNGKQNAFLNAKQFVNSRKGTSGKIAPFLIKNVHPDSALILNSVSEQVDRFSGTFAVTENYSFATNESSKEAGLENGIPAMQTANILLTYSLSITDQQGSDFVNVGLSGNVAGTKDRAVTWDQIKQDFRSRNFYDLANKAYQNYIQRTGQNIELNKSPVTFSISPNEEARTIGFTLNFDNNDLYSKAKIKNSDGAYFDYNISFQHDNITDIVSVSCNGTIRTRAALHKKNSAAKDLLDNTILVNDSKVIRDEAQRIYQNMFPSRSNYKLSPKPSDLQIRKNEFNGTITYSASFSDRDFPENSSLLSLDYSVDINPALQEYRPAASCLQDGHYLIYDLDLKQKREGVTVNTTAKSFKKDASSFSSSVLDVKSVNDFLKESFIDGEVARLDAENKVENRELANITYNRSFSHEKAVENITLERKID